MKRILVLLCLLIPLALAGSIALAAWPVDDLTTVHLDQPTDSPSLAREEIYAAVNKTKAILAELPAGATAVSQDAGDARWLRRDLSGDVTALDAMFSAMAVSNWTLHASTFSADMVMGFAFRPSPPLFVAVSSGGGLATSPEGYTWTARTSSFGTSGLRAVVYGLNGVFVAVGDGGKIATSPDGVTWTQRTNTFGISSIHDVTYSLAAGFVAAGESGKLATSPDGVTWTARTSSFGTAAIYSVHSGWNGTLVAAGASGMLATSTDGVTWTQRTSGFGASNIMRVRDGGYSGTWFIIAVGYDGKLATSPDGLIWTQRSSSFGTSDIHDVTSDLSGITVAVGVGGKIASSRDCVTWTQRPSGGFGGDLVKRALYVSSLYPIIVGGAGGKLATSLIFP